MLRTPVAGMNMPTSLPPRNTAGMTQSSRAFGVLFWAVLMHVHRLLVMVDAVPIDKKNPFLNLIEKSIRLSKIIVRL